MEWIRLEETDSTNRVAKELARQGASHGTAVLARRQTAGRGRLGRSFFSPGGGLYLSVILRPALASGDLTLMTPMAAVAVCRAVESLCGLHPGIKWVNDLYLEDKKVCGILCEAAGGAVIVGIGMNLRTPEGGFPPSLNAAALDCPVEREELAEAMACALLEECEKLPGTGFLTEYRRRDAVCGKTVTVHPVGGEPYPARALSIDHRGRLVVESERGLQALDGGEISIRF